MPKSSPPLVLSPSDRAQLEQWSSAHGTPQQVALRCNVVLGAIAGEQNRTLADRLHLNRHTVELWRARVGAQGIDAVWEIAAGRGRKPVLDQTQRDALITATLQTRPKGMTNWSCRTLARARAATNSACAEAARC